MRSSGYVALALLGGCSFSGHSQPAGHDGPDRSDAPIDAVAMIDAPTDAPADTSRLWWDSSYPYRMQIAVSNAVPLPVGYQLSVDIDLDAAPCGSQDAARIVQDHITELDRVIEPSPSTPGAERIWFKITAPLPMTAGPTSYWLYCGAAPTTPPANGDLVFDFFDTFDGAALASKWSPRNAASVTGAGELQLDNGESVSAMQTGLGETMEWSMRATATSGEYWGGLQSGATAYTAPWMVWIARQPNALHGEVLPNGTTEPNGNVIGPDHAITMVPNAYAIEYQQDHAYFRFQNGAEQDLPGSVTAPLFVRFENYSGNAAIFVSWVRLRKAVRPAPTTSLGAPEPY